MSTCQRSPHSSPDARNADFRKMTSEAPENDCELVGKKSKASPALIFLEPVSERERQVLGNLLTPGVRGGGIYLPPSKNSEWKGLLREEPDSLRKLNHVIPQSSWHPSRKRTEHANIRTYHASFSDRTNPFPENKTAREETSLPGPFLLIFLLHLSESDGHPPEDVDRLAGVNHESTDVIGAIHQPGRFVVVRVQKIEGVEEKLSLVVPGSLGEIIGH